MANDITILRDRCASAENELKSIAAKIIEKDIDEKDHEKLIEKFIDEIGDAS